MLDFTQNLLHSWINVLPASQNNRMWHIICEKKQTVAQKRISTLSVVYGLTRAVYRLWSSTVHLSLPVQTISIKYILWYKKVGLRAWSQIEKGSHRRNTCSKSGVFFWCVYCRLWTGTWSEWRCLNYNKFFFKFPLIDTILRYVYDKSSHC